MIEEEIKLVCFADETGQDTGGVFFLVATYIIRTDQETKFEDLLSEIETKSNKKFRKWSACSNSIRSAFLKQFPKNSFTTSTIFYSVFRNSKEYADHIATTIAKSILHVVGSKKYSVKIFFDRIDNKTELKIKKDLKQLRIRFKKVRGLKDESMALIRFVDAMAGFKRDCLENKSYTKQFNSFANRITKL